MLEQSLSLKSMVCRVQALVSGKSFAEIALVKSLDYQVEQVFLIHRESSLLLQHAVAESAIARDADIVSSMLSAIQAFVSDSFSVENGDMLDTLRLGELTVCIEAGPQAILAAVVHGSVPEVLRRLLHETLESIHKRLHLELIGFLGDTAVFESQAIHEEIQRCLITKQNEDVAFEDKKKPWLVIAALCVLTVMGSWSLWQSHQHERLRDRALADLNDTPGILVTDVVETSDGLLVIGLRDPLVARIEDILDQKTRDKLALSTTLRPWHSLDVPIVEQRLAESLQLPDGVNYRLSGTTLKLTGEIERAWLQDVGPVALWIPGVDTLDTSTLIQHEPVPVVPAAARPDLVAMSRDIESVVLTFDSGAIAPGVRSMAQIASLNGSLHELQQVAADQGFRTSVTVLGFSDPRGSVIANQRIKWLETRC